MSLSAPLVLRRDVSVGRGRDAPLVESAPFWAGDLSPSGVGDFVMPTVAAAPLIAGSCGPGSGPDATGAGGGGGWCCANSAEDGARAGGGLTMW